jgi:hypothetical protein
MGYNEPHERRNVFSKPQPDPGLESVIADCESELRSLNADTKEYKETLARYKDLKALQAVNQPPRISPDAVVTAAASLLGILVIVAYEQKNVMTTKALGFVKKLT